MDECIAWAKAHSHPERPDRTIWEVFEEERPKLSPTGAARWLPAAGFDVEDLLVPFDNNEYSVNASAVGRLFEIHAYADRIVIRQDRRIVPEHRRSYSRGETIYDPWHYVPAGAEAGRTAQRRAVQGLGAAGRAGRVRRSPPASNDGDLQMVENLAAVLARAAGGRGRLPSGDVGGCPLGRCRHQHPRASARSRTGDGILTPDALRLRHAPVTDWPDTINSGAPNYGGTEVLDMMGRLKLYGIRAPMTRFSSRRSSASTSHSGSSVISLKGDTRRAGALDPIPAHGRQAAAGQRCRRLRLQKRRRINEASCATSPATPSSPSNATSVVGTGTGKTHLAIAIARSCIRAGSRGDSSPLSTWSINSRPKAEPDARDARRLPHPPRLRHPR